jgi:hypothetical protein
MIRCATLRRLLRSIVFLPAVFAGQGQAQSQLSDEQLKQALVGFWTNADDSPNKYDALARSRNWHGPEEFSSDGTGRASLYKGEMCVGDPDVTEDYNWDVRQGVLVTHAATADSHDRILSVDQTRLILFSVEHQVTQYRVKTVRCQKSNLPGTPAPAN